MVRFNHEAETLFESVGFTEERWRELVQELENGHEKITDEHLVALAIYMLENVIHVGRVILNVGTFLKVLMGDVKKSYVVELLYKKLKQLDEETLKLTVSDIFMSQYITDSFFESVARMFKDYIMKSRKS